MLTAFNEPKNYAVALENKAGTLLEGIGFNEIMNLSLTKERIILNSQVS